MFSSNLLLCHFQLMLNFLHHYENIRNQMGTTYFYIIQYVHLNAPESAYFPFLLNPCSHLNPNLPLVHRITSSLVYPKALLWQFPSFSCPINFCLSVSLFPFTCLSPDHYICVYISLVYVHIYLLLFRETLFQWALCSYYLTSSAPIFSY